MIPPEILTAHQREVLRLFACERDLCDAFVRGNALPILPHLLTPIDPQTVSEFFLALAKSLKDEAIG